MRAEDFADRAMALFDAWERRRYAGPMCGLCDATKLAPADIHPNPFDLSADRPDAVRHEFCRRVALNVLPDDGDGCRHFRPSDAAYAEARP